MTPEELTSRTSRAFARMNEIYGSPVFDEWALVVVSHGKGQVLHYEGPRADAFAEAFPRDVALLREQFESREYFTGEFEFTADGHGTQFDAFVKVSDTVYLICNNTQEAMTQIRENSLWLKAQIPFAELCAQISNATFQMTPAGSV